MVLLRKPSEYFKKEEDITVDTSVQNLPKIDQLEPNTFSEAFNLFKKNVNKIETLSEYSETLDNYKLNIEKVNFLSEKIGNIETEIQNFLTRKDLDIAVMSQLFVVEQSIKDIQNKVKSINQSTLTEIRLDASNLTKVVNNFINGEVPKYKKSIVESEVRSSNLCRELENTVNQTVTDINEFVDNKYDEVSKLIDEINDSIVRNETYLKSRNQTLEELQEHILTTFSELNLEKIEKKNRELSKKITYIEEIFKKFDEKQSLNENLLAEPPSVNNQDPLTPLEKNFVTLDELQDHYRLFINRIQQQLASIGGSGETKLKYLDDIVGIATNPSIYDGKFLKYNHNIKRFQFEEISLDYAILAGIASYADIAGIATYATSAGIATYATSAGIATYATLAGIATYADIAGIATYATSAGIATYATRTGIATYADIAGIATYATSAGIATYATRAGIATYATRAGIATYADIAGIATSAGIATYATSAGIATYATRAGIATYADIAGIATSAGIATYATSAGIATYADIAGIATSAGIATYATSAGIATYATRAGIATYATRAGIATYATNAGIATYATSAGIATYATRAGIATYATRAGIATYATNAGIATYATRAGIATYATNAGIATYATNAGIATEATRLQYPRTFEITGDIVGAAVTFDGTGNVSIAATIQPNSVALGTDTTGDYVQSISGTLNQIDVTGGTGESSTPTVGFATNPTIPGNTTITGNLQVNSNLNVTGNITIGGTSAYINVEDFRVADADIILGFTTDSYGNDKSTDTTASRGGIAIASTEGSPLIDLTIAGIQTLPVTYKKIMWFKANDSFAGLNTDAWLSNYAFGIGTTSMPVGTRFAAGNVTISQDDITSVRNINAPAGIITATKFVGILTGNADTATYALSAGIATALRYSRDFSVSGDVGTSSSVSFNGTADVDLVVSLSNNFSAKTSGIITATQFSTGVSGTGINIDTNTISGPSIIYIDPAGVGDDTGIVRIKGDFYVDGTTTTINSTIVEIADSQVGIATTIGTNLLLDGAGIGIGSTNIRKTFVYNSAASSLKSSENLDIAFGKTYKIDGTDVLSKDTLGSGVLNSSLTSVGTLIKLNVGNVYSTGIVTATDFNSASDIRLKENIQKIDNPIDKIVKIDGVTFDWKSDNKSSMGVIAQNIEEVLPELVNGAESKTVNYNGIIGLLIECVKTQQEQIDNLNRKLDELSK
jgi:hypothetical protein